MHGRISWRLRELHDKYGPVVRISHDELSYTTSGAWKKIYAQRNPEFVKALDGRGIAPPSIGGRKSLMTETQNRHAALRRVINPAFSERALREQEGYLKTHSDTLITQLKKRCVEGPVDMTNWYNLTAFDIVSGEFIGCRRVAEVFINFARPCFWKPCWLSYECRAAMDQDHLGPIKSNCVVSNRDAVWPSRTSQLLDTSLCGRVERTAYCNDQCEATRPHQR